MVEETCSTECCGSKMGKAIIKFKTHFFKYNINTSI